MFVQVESLVDSQKNGTTVHRDRDSLFHSERMSFARWWQYSEWILGSDAREQDRGWRQECFVWEHPQGTWGECRRAELIRRKWDELSQKAVYTSPSFFFLKVWWEHDFWTVLVEKGSSFIRTCQKSIYVKCRDFRLIFDYVCLLKPCFRLVCNLFNSET